MVVIGSPALFMDLSKILIWNVRGLNQRARRDLIRDVVRSSMADVVCLQETKLSCVTSAILSLLSALTLISSCRCRLRARAEVC